MKNSEGKSLIGTKDGNLALRRFANTRAVMTTTDQSDRFEAWVEAVSESAVVFKMDEAHQCQVGERYCIELESLRSCATVTATCSLVCDKTVKMTIPEAFRVSSPRGNSRHRVVVETTAEIIVDRMPDFALLLDVSQEGLGIAVGFEIPEGETVDIKIPEGSSSMQLSGKVKFCVPSQEHPGAYHVGLSLNAQSRIESKRWLSIVEQFAAA